MVETVSREDDGECSILTRTVRFVGTIELQADTETRIEASVPSKYPGSWRSRGIIPFTRRGRARAGGIERSLAREVSLESKRRRGECSPPRATPPLSHGRVLSLLRVSCPRALSLSLSLSLSLAGSSRGTQKGPTRGLFSSNPPRKKGAAPSTAESHLLRLSASSAGVEELVLTTLCPERCRERPIESFRNRPIDSCRMRPIDSAKRAVGGERERAAGAAPASADSDSATGACGGGAFSKKGASPPTRGAILVGF